MRSCVVLGSGRSGTSMVTGSLAQSGYFMGAGLYRPRAANPKGFFETPEVNGINEELLAGVLARRPALADGQRWLGIPASGRVVRATPELEQRMRAALERRPFCLKDPRFSFTLPAWRPALGDAGAICVFRHPLLTAESILEECRTAAYLQGVAVDREHALALWTAQYREVLERHAGKGDWLFLHYDQVLTKEGPDRIEGFLDAEVDRSFPDRALRRAPTSDALPAEARAIYDELCERAEHLDATAPSVLAACRNKVRVSMIAVLGEADREHATELVESVRAQRGVKAELIVVDDSRGEDALQLEGARVVRATGFGAGRAYLDGLEIARGEYVAWIDPAARSLPSHLVRAVELLDGEPGIHLVTCDYFLTDADGQFVDRSGPAAMGEAPGPFWHAGAVMRRDALATVETKAFWPVELELYQRMRDEGRAAHVEEPGFHVPAELYSAAWERSRRDAALLALARRPFEGDAPELTVSLCTYDRRPVLLECLEAFSRQLVAPGTFELVLVDDGSTDGTAEMLEQIEPPVPATLLRQANGGLASARNTGLEAARGRLVLFVNDDTIPFPDMIEQHLAAHRRIEGRSEGRMAVLGTFEQPVEALDNALLRYLEGSTEVFGYGDMQPGATYDGMHFYTCNVSVPLDAVRAAGAFDTSFRHYGCEDTDLGIRLERLGFRVHYCGDARALHRHPMDFEYIVRRQRMVARAYVRFFKKHPDVLERWGLQELTAASCREQGVAHADTFGLLEDAARELAKIDVGAIERIGPEFLATAQAVGARLARLVAGLNKLWWLQGYEEGFREHGLEGFAELLAGTPVETAEVELAERAPSSDETGPDVSVIVPTRDRPGCLLEVLGALEMQDLHHDRYEVIVVDDGSARPATEVLEGREMPFHVELLRVERVGPAAARNAALKKARGDVVVFLNDDAVPAHDNLRRHLDSHRWSSEPRAVLGTFTLLSEHRNHSFAHLVETTDLLFAQPTMKAGALYHGLALCTGNLSVERSALEEVGGFDEAFPFAGGEDSELGLRLERELGMRVLYDPLIRAGHDHALDVEGFARRQRVLGWGVHHIATKHGDPSLITGDPEVAADERFWSDVRARSEAEAAEVETMVAAVAKLCRFEVEQNTGPQAPAKIEPLVRSLGEAEFRRGLLFAHAGRPVAELLDQRPIEVALPLGLTG